METTKITAEPLMVGDWVSIDNKPHKVTGIQICDGIMCVQTDYTDTYYSIENYAPIYLTAEVLEKNGFSELMLHNEWSRIFRIYLNEVFVEVGIYEPNFINVGYVDNEGKEQPLCNIVKVHGENFFFHELQHTLRLCGVDKEITI